MPRRSTQTQTQTRNLWTELGVTEEPNTGILRIPLDLVVGSKYQPRNEANTQAVEELETSIRDNGQIVPVEVRPVKREDGSQAFELLHGHRRAQALRNIGDNSIRAIVGDAGEKEAQRAALAENIGRKDLQPIELARAVKKAIEEQGLTQSEAAKMAGIAQPTVSNMLRVLDRIPASVLELVDRGSCNFTALRPLLPFWTAAELEGYSAEREIENVVDNVMPMHVYLKGGESIFGDERPERLPLFTEDAVAAHVARRLNGTRSGAHYDSLARWRPVGETAWEHCDMRHRTEKRRALPEAAWLEAFGPDGLFDFGKLGKWTPLDRDWTKLSDKQVREDRDGKTGTGGAGEAKPSSRKVTPAAVKAQERQVSKMRESLGSETEPGTLSGVVAVDPEKDEVDYWPYEGGFDKLRKALGAAYGKVSRESGSAFSTRGGYYLVIDKIAGYMDDRAEQCKSACNFGATVLQTGAKATRLGCSNFECARGKLTAGLKIRQAEGVKLRTELAQIASEAIKQAPVWPRRLAEIWIAENFTQRMPDERSEPNGTELRQESVGALFARRYSMIKDLSEDVAFGIGDFLSPGERNFEKILDADKLKAKMAQLTDEQLSTIANEAMIRLSLPFEALDAMTPQVLSSGLTLASWMLEDTDNVGPESDSSAPKGIERGPEIEKVSGDSVPRMDPASVKRGPISAGESAGEVASTETPEKSPEREPEPEAAQESAKAPAAEKPSSRRATDPSIQALRDAVDKVKGGESVSCPVCEKPTKGRGFLTHARTLHKVEWKLATDE